MRFSDYMETTQEYTREQLEYCAEKAKAIVTTKGPTLFELGFGLLESDLVEIGSPSVIPVDFRADEIHGPGGMVTYNVEVMAGGYAGMIDPGPCPAGLLIAHPLDVIWMTFPDDINMADYHANKWITRQIDYMALVAEEKLDRMFR